MAFLRFLRHLAALALAAFVLGTLLLVAVVPHLAREDLPWTPLDLDAPIGRATAGKIAALDGPRCRALLDAAGIAYRALPDNRHGTCGFGDGVSWRADVARRAAYSPAGLPLACPLAAALAVWEREVVQPAAMQRFGTRVVRIDTFGSYSCRRLYGRATGDWSEHARARAIDVAGFRLADGRRVTVAADWRKDDKDGRFLHDVRDGGCRLFATTLSPDYNAAHRDHLHLDEAARGDFWTACR